MNKILKKSQKFRKLPFLLYLKKVNSYFVRKAKHRYFNIKSIIIKLVSTIHNNENKNILDGDILIYVFFFRKFFELLRKIKN